MEQINKSVVLKLIGSMPDDATKQTFIAELVRSGYLAENDLAELAVHEIEQNLDRFASAVRDDAQLRFYWERFSDYPQYLARAMARLRPDLFYTYGLAFRVIMRLRADLGPVVIPPLRPAGEEPRGRVPMPALPKEVQADLFALDLECRFREMLYFFSQDFDEGRLLLESEIAGAKTDYDREILRAVAARVEELSKMEFPGAVRTLNGRPFPALHVRWWISLIASQPRSLNIGDTGTYKTSFAALAARYFGCKRTLILSAPHARRNWEREIHKYFFAPVKVAVVESNEALRTLDPDADFTVVGYSMLVGSGAVSELLAREFDCLVMDECQYGKGVVNAAPAKRALACQQLVNSLPLKRFMALSATPWENRPEELAAIAAALRPDLFPGPEAFLRSGADSSPRFLRELFANQVLEVELREIRDLPPIEPRPWQDLFSAVPVEMNKQHRAVYELVHDFEPEEGDEKKGLGPSEKAIRLLQAAIHPQLLESRFPWPEGLQPAFEDWKLSSKLVWLRRFIEERLADGKIVVGSGLYAEGITRLENGAIVWVGQLLKEWFGEDHILTLDGKVSPRAGRGGKSPRDQLIDRWRSDPEARILLVSMQACPDSVNLTVPKSAGVRKLSVTALSFGWKPWKQFLGRFWREGQGVPVEYAVPIVEGTIDEDLLRLNQDKWFTQQLFRAMVPLTEREWQLCRKSGAKQITEVVRTSADHVAQITSMMRGRGEESCIKAYKAKSGARTNAELFAEHFLKIQEHAGSGHISRFQRAVIEKFVSDGLLDYGEILDAGCGPLTLERRLEAPVFGVDMNPSMIELGRQHSRHGGANARVGFLSALPDEWTGKFWLTVATLSTHFSSLKPVRHKEPERLRILRELVRVTNPHGLVWLVWNRSYQTPETFRAWAEGFRAEGFAVHKEISGLVQAKEGGKKAFAFWSLVVSPNGKKPVWRTGVNPFRFPFEFARLKVVRRRADPGERSDLPPPDKRGWQKFEHFEVLDVWARTVTADTVAAQKAVQGMLRRWCAVVDKGERLDRKLRTTPAGFESDWRTLEQLRQHGLLEG